MITPFPPPPPPLFQGNRFKLCDFGIAKVKAAAAGATLASAAEAAGGGAGTAPFMAPEQFAGAGGACRVTGAADVWALGCVLAQTWTGAAPWTGHSNVQVCYRVGVGSEAPPEARGVAGRAPPPPFLARTLASCFARDPAARPSAGDLAAALEAELGKVALAAARARREGSKARAGGG